ncbi:MAG: MFS transporter [Planctomycetaceae bacterium]|nr:MFS transporter [Planctomycetaceae bacterium]
MPTKAPLLIIFLTVFIDLIGFGIVMPLLPIYAKRFGTDAHGWQIGLLMASFSAMQFIFSPLWGRLSDRIGRRPVLMVGLAGSVVFYALFGVATTMESLALLFTARIGAGIAGATISTAQAYIADVTTLEKRAKGMALIGAAFGIGFTFGPLFAFLGLPADETAHFELSPWPGYAAAILSGIALLIAWFKLPESLKSDVRAESRVIFDWRSLSDALATPSLGLLLAAWFLCVFSFANFESTLSLLMREVQGSPMTIKEICLLFAFIGLVLSLVQGGLVRRLSGRVDEVKLAVFGAATEVVGFLLLIQVTRSYSLGLVLTALAVIVSGFAFMTPSVNSLISRRSDPAKQGGILGVAQSISSLARIAGPVAGNVLLATHLVYPLWIAAGVMLVGGAMVLVAGKRGKDFPGAVGH